MKKKLNVKTILFFSSLLFLSSFALADDPPPPTIVHEGYTHDFKGLIWETIIPNKYRYVITYSNNSKTIDYLFCAQGFYFSCSTDQCMYPDDVLMCACPKDESNIENQ